MIIDNQILSLELEGGIRASNQSGTSIYKITSIEAKRNIYLLYGTYNVKIVLPLDAVMKNDFIPPYRDQRAQIVVYPSVLDFNNKTNRSVDIDGIIINDTLDIDPQTMEIEIIIADKSQKLEQQYIVPRTYNETNFKKHFNDVLSTNGFKDIIPLSQRIYPAYFNQISFNNGGGGPDPSLYLSNAYFKDKIVPFYANNPELSAANDRLANYNQTVFSYITTILNEKHVLLTTALFNNKEYLYFLDTGQEARKFAAAYYLKAGIENQKVIFNFQQPSAYPHVIRLNQNQDFTKYYDEINLFKRGSNKDYKDIGKTVKVDKSGSKTADLLLQRNTLLKINKSHDLFSNLDESAMKQFGSFILRQEVAEYFYLSITVQGYYCNQNNIPSKRIPWQIGCPLVIESDILEKLNPIYKLDIMKKNQEQFLLSGKVLKYDIKNGLTTELQIVPNSFI